MRIQDLLSEEKAAVPPKPRNFVAKNAKMGGAGQHKDKKKAEKQGDVKHKKELATMEAVEDRTSYQVAKVLFDHGIKYDPAREDELVKVIELALVKKLDIDPRQVRGIMNDEDFLGDTFGELRQMEQGVSERVRDPEDWDEGDTEPPNNFAVYINGKKWKVFQGRGQYADDAREKAHYEQLKSWAANKSESTGKKWTVSITGEPATK